ncbi:hypothetical protein GCM10009764_05810 [Nocardia ninae]|uniref:SGNH hydrolase-type esterase domain-containing protein n=2 Tax=Nocardia ninae TaxID=356145 RepID=A0A511MJN9_9NOCA|nr:hypothetical protein NN4_53790 [Nocardia ninae NBRC 108245]
MNHIEDGIAGAYAAEKTRIIPYCNGGMDQTVATTPITVNTQAGFRTSVRLPVSSTRWRVRARNYGMTGSARPVLTGKGIRLGEAARITTGSGTTSRTGGFVGNAAFNIVATDFPIPGDGGFYASPWVTDPAQQLQAGLEYLLAIAYTVASSTNIGLTIGECFYWTSVASALDPTVTAGSTIPAGIPLDLIIEYETVTTRSAWLYIGDSIAEGVMGSRGTTNSTIVPQPIWRNYPNQWAARNSALAVNMSMAGMMTSQYLPTNFPQFFSRMDLAAAQLDGAIVATGSNDFTSGGRTLAQYQADIAALMAQIRATIGEKPIYLGATIPRSSTGNSTRIAANEWLASLPYGAAGFVDFDAAMRTQVDAAALPADLTCDTIHPSFKGVELMASTLARSIPT